MKKQANFITFFFLLAFMSSSVLADNVPKEAYTDYTAIKWYRDSAEMKAMYNEVFFVAAEYIKIKAKDLKPHTWGIVLDIDETILDNSPEALERMKAMQPFSDKSFAEWRLKESALSTPGARRLLQLVHSMGGYINLVSNGDIALLAATEANLKKQGLIFDQVLLTPAGTSMTDKNPRFIAVQQGTLPSKLPAQNIIAFFGDNIQDFPNMKQSVAVTWDADDAQLWQNFGNGWFVLPNPVYGSWMANPLK